MTYRDPRPGGRFAPWLNQLRHRSGVYVFRSKLTGRVLYVGESHTGNLARTIKRHFWEWGDRTGRHHYTVGWLVPVELAVRVLPAERAIEEQARLILRLEPVHNRETPTDVVPF